MYVEDREKLNINNSSQLLCTIFIAKYVSLGLYNKDLEKQFIIDNKQLQLDKNYDWNLFGVFDKPAGTFSDHESFCIHDDLSDRIK